MWRSATAAAAASVFEQQHFFFIIPRDWSWSWRKRLTNLPQRKKTRAVKLSPKKATGYWSFLQIKPHFHKAWPFKNNENATWIRWNVVFGKLRFKNMKVDHIIKIMMWVTHIVRYNHNCFKLAYCSTAVRDVILASWTSRRSKAVAKRRNRFWYWTKESRWSRLRW